MREAISGVRRKKLVVFAELAEDSGGELKSMLAEPSGNQSPVAGRRWRQANALEPGGFTACGKMLAAMRFRLS